MKKFKWKYMCLILYVILVLYSYLHYLISAGFFTQSFFSLADLLVEVLKPGFYFKISLMPLILGVTAHLQKYRKYNQILQNKKRSSMLKEQMETLFLWSVILTLCIMVTTIIVGMQIQKKIINWGEYASYFAATTGHILPNIKFAEVLLFYTCLGICRNILVGTLLMSFFWVTDSILIGILSTISFSILNWLGNEKVFHIPWMYMYGDYSFFTDPMNIVKGILWMFLYLGFFLYLQYRFLNKKNF